MKLASPVNEGWIFSKDRKSIKLFASYDKEDDGTITFGDRTMIPKSWIVKITKFNLIRYCHQHYDYLLMCNKNNHPPSLPDGCIYKRVPIFFDPSLEITSSIMEL